MLAKQLEYLGGAQLAGIVSARACPPSHSRADSAETASPVAPSPSCSTTQIIRRQGLNQSSRDTAFSLKVRASQAAEKPQRT